MNKKLTFLLVLIFAMSMLTSCSEYPSPPIDGWRYPNKSDMENGWYEKLEHSRVKLENGVVPYHFTADLNGDGLSDDAWILIPTLTRIDGINSSFNLYKNPEYGDVRYGIFVFFKQEGGPPIISEMRRQTWGYPQGYSISELKPIEFATGNRKMEYSGITTTMLEVDHTGWYWDKETSSFVSVFGPSH